MNDKLMEFYNIFIFHSIFYPLFASFMALFLSVLPFGINSILHHTLFSP